MTDVEVGDGGIDFITLDSGEKLAADLFVDCTGWSSLLLGGALKEPFVDYTRFLPNNRAWATRIPYQDRSEQLEPYTNCTAIDHGWVWNIPLWSRIGTGYVYSDKFVTPESALSEFKEHLSANGNDVTGLEFKDIRMRVGLHKRIWVKNVLAIGLAAGFIEPLESNGLLSVHEFLMRFVDVAEDGFNGWDRDVFNYTCKRFFDDFAQFVSMHYAWSHRDDNAYWRATTQLERIGYEYHATHPAEMQAFVDLAFARCYQQRWNDNLGYPPIAAGLDYSILGRFAAEAFVANSGMSESQLMDTLTEIANNQKAAWAEQHKGAISHEEYLATRIHVVQ